MHVSGGASAGCEGEKSTAPSCQASCAQNDLGQVQPSCIGVWELGRAEHTKRAQRWGCTSQFSQFLKPVQLEPHFPTFSRMVFFSLS
jgi:hypothetical protein